MSGGASTVDWFQQNAPPVKADKGGNLFGESKAPAPVLLGTASPNQGTGGGDWFAQNAPVKAGPGERIGYSGLKDIVPKEGESFEDTMKRAVEYGKTLTTEDIKKQSKADLKVAPLALAAGPALAAGQLAVPTAVGAAVAPTVAEEQVATGVLDASGQMVYRTALKYGPSLVRQFGAKAVPWLAQNAVKAAGYGAIGSYILKKGWEWLE